MNLGKQFPLARRIRNKLARVIKLCACRIVAAISPDRSFRFYLDRPLSICMPFRNAQQLNEQLLNVAALRVGEDTFGPAIFTFVTDCPSPLEEPLLFRLSELGVAATHAPDFRSLVSFLAGAQFHVVLPQEAAGEQDSLRAWCDAFHVNYVTTAQKLMDSLSARGSLEMSGPFSATYAVHKSLWLNVMGNQYAFTEEIDWDLVKRLPRKFIEFRTTTQVFAHPITLLTGPLNRIQRQRGIGTLYKSYLQGESVVDIGCDVRGVEESVGPRTRYQGIDMHGKPDIILNLDQNDLPFAARSIDTIVCVEALEHLQRIHRVFDNILSVARKHVICSLPVEAAFTNNMLVDPLGGVFSFSTPIAPVFDRHQWVGSISDNLDFVYYRATQNGFFIRRIDLFYMPRRGVRSQTRSVLNNFHDGRVAKLNRQVGLIVFVLERKGPAGGSPDSISMASGANAPMLATPA